MSWDISLRDDAGVCKVPRFEEGGTYAVGGTEKASLNVTYNYDNYFNFGALHGKTGKQTVKTLEDAVEFLGMVRNRDYWKSTPGNVGYACNILLGWARLHPTARWDVE